LPRRFAEAPQSWKLSIEFLLNRSVLVLLERLRSARHWPSGRQGEPEEMGAWKTVSNLLDASGLSFILRGLTVWILVRLALMSQSLIGSF